MQYFSEDIVITVVVLVVGGGNNDENVYDAVSFVEFEFFSS